MTVIGLLIAGLRHLEAIHVRATRLAQLQQVYQAALPRELATRSRVSDERSGTLVVAADTSAVAAKLRQLVPRIVADIVKFEPEVTAIRVEVQVSPSDFLVALPAPRAKITGEALRSLTQLRDELPDGSLKQAVSKMVERGVTSNRKDYAFEDDERENDQC